MNVKRWEIAGVFWIIIAGSLLHFVYDWSGHSTLIALIAPVNESVWEHLKLGYWSLLLFTLVEYKYIKTNINHLFWAKAIGLLSLEITIIIIFYSYTAIINRSILWIDIGSYILGAIFCQAVSYRILKKQIYRSINKYGLFIFLAAGILLIIFAFFPPHLPIFIDHNTGAYGIK